MNLRKSKESFSLVLFGATNVGKSTLFNRFTCSRDAIVCDRPGVTVDRHEKLVTKEGIGALTIVDTGGMGSDLEQSELGRELVRAAKEAIDKADLLCLVIDGTRPLNAEEHGIVAYIRRYCRAEQLDALVVLVNKSDSKSFDMGEAYSLGFTNCFAVAAENNLGFDEFWDYVKGLRPTDDAPDLLVQDSQNEGFECLENDSTETNAAEAEASTNARVIVLGRPNVGKSTLLNALIGEDRHVVSATPGTTRDVIESQMYRGAKHWTLFDTAGMRRPGRLERSVEWVAREKLKEAAQKADVAILVVDAAEGLSDLDAAIAGMALDFGLGLIVAINKYDLIKGEESYDIIQKLERTLDVKMASFSWLPVVKLSALSGRGLKELIKTVEHVHEQRQKRVRTSQLNELFDRRLKRHPHPALSSGKNPSFYYVSQVSVSPPEFVVFSNVSTRQVQPAFVRFVEKAFREEFSFVGTPLRVHFKNNKEDRGKTLRDQRG